MEDMGRSVGRHAAVDIVADSAEIGDLLHPDVEDRVYVKDDVVDVDG